MHAMAESSMFYLQTAAATSGEANLSLTAMRQSQAVDNLTVILDSIGEQNRALPQSGFWVYAAHSGPVGLRKLIASTFCF